MHVARADATSFDDAAHVLAVVREAGSSFFWAMRLLPPERRRAVFAVYAFCREVDDVADAPSDPATKLAELEGWRREIEALYRSAPTRPTTRALLDAVERFNLARADFDAVIEGVAMDARAPIVAPDYAVLERYCDRVAGAVGRLCVCIFGAGNEAGRAVAGHLGQALQLTNILRDVDEDAALGRLYLPREVLERHGVPLDRPAAAVSHPEIDATCRDVAATAAAAYRRAEVAMAQCDPRAMRPAHIMMQVYRCTFDRLCDRGWRPTRAPVKPSKLVKFWIAARCLAGWRR